MLRLLTKKRLSLHSRWLQGADSDPQAKIGCTPLHRAAEQGHLEVCTYLQGKGADINFQDRGKGWTPLLLAALHGRGEVCTFLVESAADVNTCNRYGETSLHMAAQPGHVEIVKLLLTKGADATLQQVRWCCCRMLASRTTTAAATAAAAAPLPYCYAIFPKHSSISLPAPPSLPPALRSNIHLTS